MATIHSSRPKLNIKRWVKWGLAAWALFHMVRAYVLIGHALQLGKTASTFPRDYYLGDPKSPKLIYLVLGDSTAAGWGAKTVDGTYPYFIAHELANQGFHVHVVNAAVGGARLQDVKRNQLSALNQLHPDLITVSIGANDTTHFTSEADFSRDLKVVLSRLERSGTGTILFANTPEMARAPALPWPLGLAANRRALRQNEILKLALAGLKIQEIDLYNQGKLDYNLDHALYAGDLFHPSEKGYAVWAKVFTRALKNAPISSHTS